MADRAIDRFGSLSIASRSNCSRRALASRSNELCENPRGKIPDQILHEQDHCDARPLASTERALISSARSKARRASCVEAVDRGRWYEAQPGA